MVRLSPSQRRWEAVRETSPRSLSVGRRRGEDSYSGAVSGLKKKQRERRRREVERRNGFPKERARRERADAALRERIQQRAGDFRVHHAGAVADVQAELADHLPPYVGPIATAYLSTYPADERAEVEEFEGAEVLQAEDARSEELIAIVLSSVAAATPLAGHGDIDDSEWESVEGLVDDLEALGVFHSEEAPSVYDALWQGLPVGWGTAAHSLPA